MLQVGAENAPQPRMVRLRSGKAKGRLRVLPGIMLPLPTPRCIAARADRVRSARTTSVTLQLRGRPCVPPCPALRVAALILGEGRLEGTGALLSSRDLEATRRSHPVAAAAPAPHVPRLVPHLRKRAATRRPKSASSPGHALSRQAKLVARATAFSANARVSRRGSRTAARRPHTSTTEQHTP
jgi:hypothetical protein